MWHHTKQLLDFLLLFSFAFSSFPLYFFPLLPFFTQLLLSFFPSLPFSFLFIFVQRKNETRCDCVFHCIFCQGFNISKQSSQNTYVGKWIYLIYTLYQRYGLIKKYTDLTYRNTKNTTLSIINALQKRMNWIFKTLSSSN